MRGVARSELLTPLRRRVVMVIVLLSGAATIVSMLYGAELKGIVPSASDSYGGGPLGHRLFAETLIELGYSVAQNRGSHFEGSPNPMLFLEPKISGRAGGFDHQLSDALESRIEAGLPTLVAIPKWRLVPTNEGTPEVAQDMVGPGMVGELVLPGAALTITPGSDPQQLQGVLGEFQVEIPRLQVFTSLGTYDEVLLDGPYGAVVVRSPDGLVVVSDPDLFHNFNYHRAQHADLSVALLQRALLSQSDTLVLDEVFHGHGATFNIGEAMGEFPAVLLVVHLVVLLLLLFSVGTHRFGPALPPRQLGHGPTEAIGVSASVLADGQRAGQIVLQYVNELVLHTHEKLGLPEKRTIEEYALALDEAATQRGVPATAAKLLERAVLLQNTKNANSELWGIAQRIHLLRQQLISPRGRSAGAPSGTLSDANKTQSQFDSARAGSPPKTDSPKPEQAA